jgi:hypothetical protein
MTAANRLRRVPPTASLLALALAAVAACGTAPPVESTPSAPTTRATITPLTLPTTTTEAPPGTRVPDSSEARYTPPTNSQVDAAEWPAWCSLVDGAEVQSLFETMAIKALGTAADKIEVTPVDSSGECQYKVAITYKGTRQTTGDVRVLVNRVDDTQVAAQFFPGRVRQAQKDTPESFVDRTAAVGTDAYSTYHDVFAFKHGVDLSVLGTTPALSDPDVDRQLLFEEVQLPFTAIVARRIG